MRSRPEASPFLPVHTQPDTRPIASAAKIHSVRISPLPEEVDRHSHTRPVTPRIPSYPRAVSIKLSHPTITTDIPKPDRATTEQATVLPRETADGSQASHAAAAHREPTLTRRAIVSETVTEVKGDGKITEPGTRRTTVPAADAADSETLSPHAETNKFTIPHMTDIKDPTVSSTPGGIDDKKPTDAASVSDDGPVLATKQADGGRHRESTPDDKSGVAPQDPETPPPPTAAGGAGKPPISIPPPTASGAEEPEPERPTLAAIIEAATRVYEQYKDLPGFPELYRLVLEDVEVIRGTQGEQIPVKDQNEILATMTATAQYAAMQANKKAAQAIQETEAFRNTALKALNTATESLGKPYRTAQETAKIAQEEAKIARKAAKTDPLTGIPNRRSFYEDATDLLDQARREGINLAFLFLDGDKFKNINERFGHDGGDQALVIIAEAIKNSVRAGDLYWRFAGDEFNLLLKKVTPKETVEIARRLQGEITRVSTSAEMPFSASIGIAFIEPEDPHSLEGHASAADVALFRAKKNQEDPDRGSTIVFATDEDYKVKNKKYRREK